MTCTCPDYEPNISIINGYIGLQHMRMGFGGYEGKPIQYCPWCGSLLVEELK